VDEVEDSRAVVPVDLDGDGGLDLVLGNNDAEPTIYRNRVASDGHWLELDLVGTESNRDAIGAVVRTTVRLPGGDKTLLRQVEAGSGYASQGPLTLHFGLGGADRVEEVEIRWPSGAVERFGPAAGTGPLEADRRWTVVEGAGVLRPRNPDDSPRTPASEPSVLAGSISSRAPAGGTGVSTVSGGAR
jgi:hypothetical protein